MDKIPLVIDTDPGVDDSLAICLSQSMGCFDLRAITPVVGNVELSWTLRNALFLKQKLGLSCRVAAGASKPILKPYSDNAAIVHGAEGIDGFKVPQIHETADSKPAWDVIYEEALRANGRLRIVTIGPLTNLAIAVEKYPDLPSLIDGFYVMGGGTFGNRGAAEFNIWIDPDAADRVFKAFEVRMVGLDACYKAALNESDLDELIGLCDKDDFLRTLFRHLKSTWLEKGFATNVPYDPMVVACASDPSLAVWKKSHVRVDTDLKSSENGRTIISECKPGDHPAYVADSVDSKRFYALLKDMIRHFNN